VVGADSLGRVEGDACVFLDTAPSISCDSFGTSFDENEKATALESVASH
jgi:hypothetical protein